MKTQTNLADRAYAINDGIASSYHNDMRRALAGQLNSLQPIEERLVRIYFGIGVESQTMAEIAQAMGVRLAFVEKQIHKALLKLKHPARSRKFRGCMDHDISISSTTHWDCVVILSLSGQMA